MAAGDRHREEHPEMYFQPSTGQPSGTVRGRDGKGHYTDHYDTSGPGYSGRWVRVYD